jgi:hypothetical protein
MESQEDQNKLVATVKAISEKYWGEQNSPVLLSTLPKILETEAQNYRAVLGTRTLKVFIKETEEAAGYKLVEHPTQRARVGVAPASADYEFPLEPPPKTVATKSNREATLAFFMALATLPDAELDKVVIPASALVKLLK